MNLNTVTSKALNTYRNDPVLIQVDLRDEGRGYQTGVAQLCLRARLCSLCTHKAPALGDLHGTEAAAEESRRWGRAPWLFPSAEGLSSPARPAASVHALPLPWTDVLSSMEGSGSRRVWAIPSDTRRRQGGVGKGADLITHHTAGVARAATPSPPLPSAPQAESSSSSSPQSSCMAACFPPSATCLPSSTISAEKIQHPERREGKSFTQFNWLLDYVSRQCWEVCVTYLGGFCQLYQCWIIVYKECYHSPCAIF